LKDKFKTLSYLNNYTKDSSKQFQIIIIFVKSNQTKSNIIMGLFYVIINNPRRYGGLLIHFGVVLMFSGFAGAFFKVERNMTLESGVSQQIGEYSLKYKQVE
jgi:cytochrome c-type biogenesis protein CcmF